MIRTHETDCCEIIELSAYSLNAIKKVCYKLSSELSTRLLKIDDEKIKVIFEFNTGCSHEKQTVLIQKFYSELLDQDLREIVFKETEGVRNVILAHAFSKTTLIEAE